MLANAKATALYAMHLSPARTSFDYAASFSVTMPILSLEAKGPAAGEPQSESPIQVFTVQTQAIQQYSLLAAQCQPASSPPDAVSRAPSQEPSAGLSALLQAPPQAAVVSESLHPSSSLLGSSGNGVSLPPASAPLPPMPAQQPQLLLTPSQLMQAARANLSRSTSGVRQLLPLRTARLGGSTQSILSKNRRPTARLCHGMSTCMCILAGSIRLLLQASSMDTDGQHRPSPGSASFPQRHFGFQATTPTSVGQTPPTTIAEEPEKAPATFPPKILKRSNGGPASL